MKAQLVISGIQTLSSLVGPSYPYFNDLKY